MRRSERRRKRKRGRRDRGPERVGRLKGVYSSKTEDQKE